MRKAAPMDRPLLRYFVLTKRFDGKSSFSLCDGPPPQRTKLERRLFQYIYLSEAGAGLPLYLLIALHQDGHLEGSAVWTSPDPHKPAPGAAPKTYNPLAKLFRRSSVAAAPDPTTERKDSP
jgi:hypothetical protein